MNLFNYWPKKNHRHLQVQTITTLLSNRNQLLRKYTTSLTTKS